jgi:hypothetical protein
MWALVYGRDGMGRGVICKIQRALVNGQDAGGATYKFAVQQPAHIHVLSTPPTF